MTCPIPTFLVPVCPPLSSCRFVQQVRDSCRKVRALLDKLERQQAAAAAAAAAATSASPASPTSVHRITHPFSSASSPRTRTSLPGRSGRSGGGYLSTGGRSSVSSGASFFTAAGTCGKGPASASAATPPPGVSPSPWMGLLAGARSVRGPQWPPGSATPGRLTERPVEGNAAGAGGEWGDAEAGAGPVLSTPLSAATPLPWGPFSCLVASGGTIGDEIATPHLDFGPALDAVAGEDPGGRRRRWTSPGSGSRSTGASVPPSASISPAGIPPVGWQWGQLTQLASGSMPEDSASSSAPSAASFPLDGAGDLATPTAAAAAAAAVAEQSWCSSSGGGSPVDADDVAPRACGGSGRSSPSGAECANGSGCVDMLDEERIDMLADGSDCVDVLAMPAPPFPLYAGNEVHAGDIDAIDAATAAAVALPETVTEAAVGAGSVGPQPDGHRQIAQYPVHQQPPSFGGSMLQQQPSIRGRPDAVLWLDYSGQQEVGGGSPSLLDALVGGLGALRTSSRGATQQCWADVVLVLDLQVEVEGGRRGKEMGVG